MEALHDRCRCNHVRALHAGRLYTCAFFGCKCTFFKLSKAKHGLEIKPEKSLSEIRQIMSYSNRREYQQKYRKDHRQELDAYIKGWRAERKLKREVARQIEQKPIAPAQVG